MTVLRRTLAAIIAAGDWDEEKHPRDDHGRFAPDGSGPTERDYAMPGKIQEEIHGKPPPEDGERELEHFDLGHPATQQDIDRFASRYPEGDPRRAKVEGLKPGGPKQDGREFWRELAERASARGRA